MDGLLQHPFSGDKARCAHVSLLQCRVIRITITCRRGLVLSRKLLQVPVCYPPHLAMSDTDHDALFKHHFGCLPKLLNLMAYSLELPALCKNKKLIAIPLEYTVPSDLEDFDRFMSDVQNQLYQIEEKTEGEATIKKLVRSTNTVQQCANRILEKLKQPEIDSEKMKEYKTFLEQKAKDVKDQTENAALHDCIMQTNERIDGLLQRYRLSNSTSRMFLQRQVDMNRSSLKHMLFINEDLAFLSKADMTEVWKKRKECVKQSLINLIDLQLEVPHRTRVPQLPPDAVGVNYSFNSWEDEMPAQD